MPPRCFTLGTNLFLHPAPIKEHKEPFDSIYKHNMTNNCVVYCLIGAAAVTLRSTPPPCRWLLCLMSESGEKVVSCVKRC